MSRDAKIVAARHPYASDNARWAAIQLRDAAADGTFYYSVITTGIYCRPSCASRQPRRANVAYHASCAAAEAAGFRACKRCRPDAPADGGGHAHKIAAACRTIEASGPSDSAPLLAELARAANMSPFHFHRVFKALTGMTPKAYAVAHRRARVRATLPTTATVTDALYDAGYASSSRFYADAAKALGMRPSAYKAGGVHTALKFAVGQCSLGAILVAATDKGVAAVLLGDDADALLRDLKRRFPRAELIPGGRDFKKILADVIASVDQPGAARSMPLDVRGTLFQEKVWRALQDIPAGTTASYTEIAHALGMPKAARAVALACAANPAAVVIPCHRVVRTDGALSGYRWGIARKKTLLEREANSAGRATKRAREK